MTTAGTSASARPIRLAANGASVLIATRRAAPLVGTTGERALSSNTQEPLSASERAPLIGITGHVTETSLGRKVVAAGEAYVEAIRLAGGFPVLLTPVEGAERVADTLAYVDGILFTGGKDVDPAHYGEEILNTKV